jgi:hypothetical protein
MCAEGQADAGQLRGTASRRNWKQAPGSSMRIVLLLLSTLLAGCLATVQHQTASGRPEVTIAGKVARRVQATLTNDMLNLGYVPKARSDTVAVFEKPQEAMSQFLFGGIGESKPVYRLTFDIVESDASTRVVGSYAAVQNPGGGGGRVEKVISLDDIPESKEIQATLDALRQRIEKR